MSSDNDSDYSYTEPEYDELDDCIDAYYHDIEKYQEEASFFNTIVTNKFEELSIITIFDTFCEYLSFSQLKQITTLSTKCKKRFKSQISEYCSDNRYFYINDNTIYTKQRHDNIYYDPIPSYFNKKYIKHVIVKTTGVTLNLPMHVKSIIFKGSHPQEAQYLNYLEYLTTVTVTHDNIFHLPTTVTKMNIDVSLGKNIDLRPLKNLHTLKIHGPKYFTFIEYTIYLPPMLKGLITDITCAQFYGYVDLLYFVKLQQYHQGQNKYHTPINCKYVYVVHNTYGKHPHLYRMRNNDIEIRILNEYSRYEIDSPNIELIESRNPNKITNHPFNIPKNKPNTSSTPGYEKNSKNQPPITKETIPSKNLTQKFEKLSTISIFEILTQYLSFTHLNQILMLNKSCNTQFKKNILSYCFENLEFQIDNKMILTHLLNNKIKHIKINYNNFKILQFPPNIKSIRTEFGHYLKSIQNFNTLKHLTAITIEFAYENTVNYLPATLERLNITTCKTTIYAEIIDFRPFKNLHTLKFKSTSGDHIVYFPPSLKGFIIDAVNTTFHGSIDLIYFVKLHQCCEGKNIYLDPITCKYVYVVHSIKRLGKSLHIEEDEEMLAFSFQEHKLYNVDTEVEILNQYHLCQMEEKSNFL